MEDTTVLTRAPAEEEPAEGARSSRRSFLGTAAGLTGVALAAGAWRPANDPRSESPISKTVTASKFALELDGSTQGFVKAVAGGAIFADVITESGATYYRKKHIGTPKYEDFELQIDLSMSKVVYQWINDSWTGNAQSKSGAIVAADFNLNPISRREFKNALIAEVTIPACDASSKDAAYMTLRLDPESIQKTPASGKLGGSQTSKQTQWLSSNFRFDIQTIDATKVSKIDEFSVKQTATGLEFGNLVVTMPESSTGTGDWSKWFEDFVVKQNSGDDQEKPATLSFLSSSLKDVLAHIHFFNVGIFRLEETPQLSNADTIKKVMAHLYYERAEFHIGGESGPGGPPVCLVCGTR